MATSCIHTFDNRHPLIVHPGEIKPGDWLMDPGMLRCVESVFGLAEAGGPGMLDVLHFVEQPGVPNNALGISTRTESVTVWRDHSTP